MYKQKVILKLANTCHSDVWSFDGGLIENNAEFHWRAEFGTIQAAFAQQVRVFVAKHVHFDRKPFDWLAIFVYLYHMLAVFQWNKSHAHSRVRLDAFFKRQLSVFRLAAITTAFICDVYVKISCITVFNFFFKNYTIYFILIYEYNLYMIKSSKNYFYCLERKELQFDRNSVC